MRHLPCVLPSCVLTMASSLLLTLAQPSQACSLVDGPPAELKRAMMPHLAEALSRYTNLKFTAEDLREDDLAKPGVIFLDGLGSRCEGLEHTIRVSTFQIHRAFANGMNCDLRGVVVMRGYWYNDSKVAFHTIVDQGNCVTVR